MQNTCKKCNKQKKPEGLDPILDGTMFCHCKSEKELKDYITWEVDKKVPNESKEFPNSYILGTEIVGHFEIVIGKHIATHSDEEIKKIKEDMTEMLSQILFGLIYKNSRRAE